MTLPSAPSVVPRLFSTNSPEMCSLRGSMVSTRDGGIDAQCSPVNTIVATSIAMMSMTMMAQRRSAASATATESVRGISTRRRHWTAPRGRKAKK